MGSKAGDLKALRVMYIALLAGQLLFGLIAIFLVNRGFASSSDPSMGSIFLIISIVTSVGLVSASYIFFRRRLDELRALTDLASQLQAYRAASILKWAMAEGPYLLTIIGYLMTGQPILLAIAGALFLNFSFNYPSKDRLVKDLQLSSQDESLFA